MSSIGYFCTSITILSQINTRSTKINNDLNSFKGALFYNLNYLICLDLKTRKEPRCIKYLSLVFTGKSKKVYTQINDKDQQVSSE